MGREKEPYPTGFWETGDWVIVLLGLCFICVCLAGFAVAGGG